MLVSVPIKAETEYIKLCNEVKWATSIGEFDIARIKAEIYGKAIKDICGVSAWGQIVMQTDTEVGSDDCPTCCGIPLQFKIR